MPGDHGVGTRRQILQVKLSVFIGDLEIRVRQDGHIRLHPWMDVALHGDSDFLAGERLLYGRGPGGLRLVPLAIILGDWVDVMRGLVVVHDVDVLAHLYGHHMWM